MFNFNLEKLFVPFYRKGSKEFIEYEILRMM